MNSLKKIERSLTALAMAPLSGFEKKGREKKLDDRLRRLEQKHSRH